MRTDLALERNKAQGQTRGVQQSDDQRITVTTMHIAEQQERETGIPQGTYVTIDVPEYRHTPSEFPARIIDHGTKTLQSLFSQHRVQNDDAVLVVGLGNRHVTPDALGPRVVDDIVVTRHWGRVEPSWSGYRIVSACAPGVLGITGMETSEVVQSIVEHTRPRAVVLVDALASRSLSRVYTTIQFSDAGLSPGSGVGNHRKPITRAVLGVPVFVIGVPTVVYASTIVQDTLDAIERIVRARTDVSKDVLGILSSLSSEQRRTLAREILEPTGDDLVVTPKEVDQFIEDMGSIIAQMLNKALQPDVIHMNPLMKTNS
ncbi:MAG: GPR endopeptidase [Paenibacillaceae bacterium]|nr:GPR endopeptidase [Paenibacillaceae bacterium]